VVHDFSRDCLALVVDNSLSGVRVARENSIALSICVRCDCMVVSDNGTALTSRAILE
jgi:putative transposase